MIREPAPGHPDLVGVRWIKSSFSTVNDCVEVGRVAAGYLVRDSKNPGQRPLLFTGSEFRAFLAGVKAGEFDHLC
jgi:hypothetical protein